MSDSVPDTQNLWQETPLLLSAPISRLLGANAFLKFENAHPSHAYKFRGMSLFVRRALQTHGKSVHFVIASGGNAGLAVACAANIAGAKCTVYLPEGASESTMRLLEGQNAEVIVVGKYYLEAVNAANEAASSHKNVVRRSDFMGGAQLYGHRDIEAVKTVGGRGTRCDMLQCWGRGMLAGIIVGCNKVDWDHVPLVALETIGSNCFHHSVLINSSGSSTFATELPPYVDRVHDSESNLYLAHFKGFSSKASGSLGASQPATGAVKMALARKGGIQCVSVPDELSMQSAVAFANDHKTLVELACSTTLSAAYKAQLLDTVIPPRSDGQRRNVVFIVCGGFKVDLKDLAEFEKVVEEQLEKDPNGAWDVIYNDGKVVSVDYMANSV
ncbi:hypothetical protein D9757_008299 [Collybiopsis confluens]|uniref:L-serine ammonia-lyase n=1 Tax=Collybiopsis confluens TaxID=2823264 RepID=A0A8H5M0W4_9AGAR|nr:hypothetical protein D9757_008299 [Collybiopsis confluens]